MESVAYSNGNVYLYIERNVSTLDTPFQRYTSVDFTDEETGLCNLCKYVHCSYKQYLQLVKLFDKEEGGFYPFVCVTDRWQTHAAIPFNERACTLCLKL